MSVTGRVVLVVVVLAVVLLLLPREVLAGLLAGAWQRRHPARWCPFCSRYLRHHVGQHIEHMHQCRRPSIARVVGPEVTGGRSPITCGRHPDVPGAWDARPLPDGLPVGWFCPACRAARGGVS